jgi:predicted transcriptional regulator
MRTVHIGIISRDDFKRRAIEASKGKKQGEHIGFASFERMQRTLTPNRLALLRAMLGQGPMGIRELARKLKRDVKSVHIDIVVLTNSGVVDRTESGGVVFPYDAVHVDFVVKAA